MGKINDILYKNRFITPDTGKGTLEIYMEGKKLDREMFKKMVEPHLISEINIFAGLLDQASFNNMIDLIRMTTDKEIFISYIPVLEENEELEEAYVRYINNYRIKELLKDPENAKVRHFPDNISINHTFVDTDTEEANLIHKKDLHM